MSRLTRTILQPIATARLPVLRWSVLSVIAVGGSMLFGASLALVLPGWTFSGAALWLTLSAGLAWCVFIPTLAAVGRVSLVECVDACLVTMAAGEVVLTFGALANGLLAATNARADAAAINLGIVAVSNVVMAVVLARLLRRHLSPQRTLLAWMLVLNGSGAVFFALLLQLFHTP